MTHFPNQCLDPIKLASPCRKVFFTDYGQIPKVERCDMDGHNRTKLVDTKIVFPHGITLDLVSRLVYWADAYLDYIEVVDYEGKGRQTIIQGILVREMLAEHGSGLGIHCPGPCGEGETFAGGTIGCLSFLEDNGHRAAMSPSGVGLSTAKMDRGTASSLIGAVTLEASFTFLSWFSPHGSV